MPSYPYSLIPTPPGDWRDNIFDMQAIRMASVHNTFIRAINSIFYHAPDIPPEEVPLFMNYCQVVYESVHHHHNSEEEVAFPYLEAKLGKGTMGNNVAQHADFSPKFSEWSNLCSEILAGKAEYQPQGFTDLLRQSADVLYVHLVDEISSLESSLLQKHCTKEDLEELERALDKQVMKQASLWRAPIMFVNGDTNFNSWFPEIPGPVLFLLRHVVMNISGSMWKYGQSDKYMQLKEEFKAMYGL